MADELILDGPPPVGTIKLKDALEERYLAYALSIVGSANSCVNAYRLDLNIMFQLFGYEALKQAEFLRFEPEPGLWPLSRRSAQKIF
jgi:hypothetical protein